MWLFTLGVCLTSASICGIVTNYVIENKVGDRRVVQPDNIVTIQQLREK